MNMNFPRETAEFETALPQSVSQTQAMPACASAGNAVGARQIYFSLLDNPPSHTDAAAAFLKEQIALATSLPIDLPEDLYQLDSWLSEHTEQVGLAYRDYLAGRKAGGQRRYFPTRSHALHFIKAAAPTKLVDGAWLYALLGQSHDPRYHGLIRTYLEELGDGDPSKNHVVIYQKLLANQSCDDWESLDDHHFIQGAIQLCLAHGGEQLLPEIIGYNLGYEQLPLHLLICSYELNELGIDPYYFTLHTTIDNAANGHARKAAQAVAQLAPVLNDDAQFLRRVRAGYQLNELGASTLSVIASFDLESELVAIMMAKSQFGKNMHSDYCRVQGRSVNDWLTRAEDVPAFLAALEQAGWIKRGEPAENSRFWNLIHGPRAEMFGVFTDYEQQVLRDWIGMSGSTAGVVPRVATHRAQMRQLDQLGLNDGRTAQPGAPAWRGLIRHRPGDEASPGADGELHALEQQIASLGSKPEALRTLIPLMAPALHHTPVGLMATRLYTQLLAS